MEYDNSVVPVKPGGHVLPPLQYPYDALEPVIDSQTLRIHHDILHKRYVDSLNTAELAMVSARSKGDFEFIKYWENALAFNGSGDILHSVYWTNMTYPGMGGSPGEYTLSHINWYFGSFDAFKAQFIAASKAVEASGWGILGYNTAFYHLEILQCEKHQNLTQWGIIPILVCDVWEHAYFLQYQAQRDKFVDAWWQLINWNDVNWRLLNAAGGKLPLM